VCFSDFVVASQFADSLDRETIRLSHGIGGGVAASGLLADLAAVKEKPGIILSITERQINYITTSFLLIRHV